MAVFSALILLAAPSASPPPPTMAVRLEARASVRIVRGARLTWDPSAAPPVAARATRATVRLEDGRRAAAHLIEFE